MEENKFSFLQATLTSAGGVAQQDAGQRGPAAALAGNHRHRQLTLLGGAAALAIAQDDVGGGGIAAASRQSGSERDAVGSPMVARKR